MSLRESPRVVESRAETPPEPRCLTEKGYQDDVDRRLFARIQTNSNQVTHLPCSDSGNSEHRKSGSTQLGEQSALAETTNDTNNKNVGDKIGKASCGASLPQSDPNAYIKKPGWRARRKRARHKQKLDKADALPQSAHTRAYKAAGLDTAGLWSFSQRNRAAALAVIEPEPDASQIRLFKPQ